MPLFLGQLVSDRYRIDALVDQDDSGVLYRAWDMHLNTPVTFIENPDTTAAAQEKFGREAERLTRLSHSSLPRVIDHFKLPGQGQYLVMEFVEGEELQTRLNESGVLPEREALKWIGQAGAALAYLRGQRNAPLPAMEPGDVLLRPDDQIVLMGFALLRRHTPGKSAPVDERQLVRGYSAPEQYGQGESDERSDVYTLGAALYYLLTNQRPPESIQLATGSAHLLPPSQLNPEISATVEQFVQKAMSPDATRRYQSLAEFQHQLRSLELGKPVAAETESPAAASEVAATPAGQTMPTVMSVPATEQSGSSISPLLLGGLGVLLGAILMSIFYFTMISGSVDPASAPATGQSAAVATSNASAADDNGPGAAATLVDFPSPTPETLEIEVDAPGSNTGSVTPIDIIVDEQTGARLVLVPGGPFTMGGEQGSEDALPAREVTVGDFYIDQTEVTNAQYAACVAAGACMPPANSTSYTREDYFDTAQFAGYPVLQVSWEQAFTFCAWRNARLPTEAEWEKAARGDEERLYPWGEGVDCSLANWATSSGACVGDTTVAGAYPAGAGPYGALDMAGNVWEWVADWYAADYYATAPDENPPGPEAGDFKVLRGGSWVSNELNIRTAFRNNLEPASTSSNIGFRCAVSVEP